MGYLFFWNDSININPPPDYIIISQYCWKAKIVNYDIFLCRKCAAVCAGREGASTFKCCYCGTVNRVDKNLRLASCIESKNVSDVIARIKMTRADRSKSLG
jgi:hypothetical protein